MLVELDALDLLCKLIIKSKSTLIHEEALRVALAIVGNGYHREG
jgi:hypothetical protein